MTSNRVTANALDRAALKLETDGWCRRRTTDDEGRHCAIGAINAVTRSEDVARSAALALALDINPSVPRASHLVSRTVADYNDRVARNCRQVVARMRKVARQLRDA